MIKHALLPLFVLVSMVAALPAHAQKVVLENFSALDCSQSPDSEDNIGQILKDQKDVLVISCHVKLSGDETEFSKKVCSEKKSRYLMNYTLMNHASPTIIVNGTYMTKGFYPKIVSSAVNMARVEDNILNLPLKIDNDILTAELPDQGEKGYYELWFYAYDKLETRPITLPGSALRVEKKFDVGFHNVVKTAKRLGSWDGRGETISIPLKDLKTDGYAILAQGFRAGPILAAGYVEPPKVGGYSAPANVSVDTKIP